VIPSGAHGTSWGVLNSASLAGMAVSPMVAGLLGATSMRTVFVVDVALMGLLALLVSRMMVSVD